MNIHKDKKTLKTIVFAETIPLTRHDRENTSAADPERGGRRNARGRALSENKDRVGFLGHGHLLLPGAGASCPDVATFRK